MKKYNWKPDLPDIRDQKYCKVVNLADGVALPASVDLRPFCSPVFDQGQIGSCTANSLAGNLEFLELQEQKASQTNQPEEFDAKFENFSRLFIYWNERVMEGDPTQDGGAQIRDGIKTLATIGACMESSWPYDPNQLYNQPSPDCFTQAATHKITQYMRLETIDDMKHCLASGFPFVFGFTVYEQMESPEMAQTGQLEMPGMFSSSLGGHAVMCVGYDDATQNMIIRNSWGPNWGLAGYFLMPYEYISNSDLTSDFWTIRH